MASPSSARTLTITRYVFSTFFLILSGTGLYFMRIFPAQVAIPINFEDISRNQHLNVPFQYVNIPQHYTGIKQVDGLLAMLVSAFAHGALRLDENAYWQQIHFLLGFFPILAVWTIEAFRERNRGKLVSYTSVWALFYQTIGGAFVIPLHNLSYIVTARSSDYLGSGRLVPVNIAKVLTPSLLLGYLIPTVSMFLPFFSQRTTLYLVAIWQFTPLYVNILIAVLSRQASGSESMKKRAAPDVSHLKLVYIISILAASIAHVFTMSNVLLGKTREASLLSIFIPSYSQLLKSTGQDLHFIFQWDWVIIATSSLTWAIYAIMEVQTELKASKIESNLGGFLILLPIHLLFEGPGGALAAVWWWRENGLLQIERQTNEKIK